MIFLQPAAFALLLGAAVILALYLLRSPRQQRRIPTTALWLRLKDVSRVTDRRKRTLISLAIQLLIFLLIVGGAARPYLLEEGKSQVRTVALLIDVSASMQIEDANTGADRESGESRLEAAKGKARQILAGLRRRGGKEENDRGLVIQVGAKIRILQNLTDNADDLVRAVGRIEQTSEVADYVKASRLLGQLARAWPDLEVYVISDGQLTEEARKAWRGVGQVEAAERSASITYVPVGGPSGNVGIVNFAARRNLDAVSDFEVATEVCNFGPEPVTCRLELRMSTAREELESRCQGGPETNDETGVLMDVFALELAPGDRQLRVLRKGNVPLEGIVKARLTEISGENRLLQDDSAAQLIPRTRRAKTVLITEEQGDFLLGVMRANIGIQAYRLPVEDYRPNLPVDAYLFVDYRPEKLPPKNVLLINTRGRVAIPGSAKSDAPDVTFLTGESIEDPKVRAWNRHHPVMNRVSFQNLILGKAFRVTADAAAETVARTESGPLVLAFERGRQKLVYVGFSPQDSDLVFRSAFPLVVDNCVRWFMADEGPAYSRPIRPGEPKHITPESDAASIQVYTDAESPVSVPVAGGSATIDDICEPGIYLYEDGGRLRAFAANLSSDLESSVSVRESLDIGEAGDEEEYAAAGVADRRLWPYLIFLVPLLLLLESYLFHRRVAF